MDNDLLKGNVLDFGCGLGKDVEVLKSKNVNIIGYDPFYCPEYPTIQFDTIICFYVLNVLQNEDQSMVIMNVSALLKPGGCAYFAVRRDLQYEGFRLHKIHNKLTYQCNVTLNFQSIFKNELCEIYQFKHFNQYCRDENSGCPFCNLSIEREIIIESATVYSIYDKYPVSPGHSLIIPKKHVANYFDLSFRDQTACIFMANRLKKIIDEKYKPDGYNFGVNVNEFAGQTIQHVHWHFIPRYKNDVESPIGGIRNIIPGKGNYLEKNNI